MGAAAAASMFFGASVVATRFVIDQVDPANLAFLRYLIAAICLWVPLWGVPRPGVQREHRLPIFALGVLFFGVFPWTFSAALQSLSASRGAVILGLMPLLTLVLARLSGTEVLTPCKLAGVALTFGGVALALGAGDPASANPLLGSALMLLTATCGAAYNVFSRPYIARYSPLLVTALSMLAGTLFLLPLAAWRTSVVGLPGFTAAGWLAVLFLGTLGGAVGFWLWTWALGRISATRVAVFLTLNPMTAAFLAMLLLGESLTTMFLLGLAAVVAGIALANRRDPPPAAPLTAPNIAT